MPTNSGESDTPKSEYPVTKGFDEAMADKIAECDGGGHIPGTYFAGRQEFTGTLTGEYFDHGDPPWRWYLMKDLTRKPEAYADETVWCQADSVFLIED